MRHGNDGSYDHARNVIGPRYKSHVREEKAHLEGIQSNHVAAVSLALNKFRKRLPAATFSEMHTKGHLHIATKNAYQLLAVKYRSY